MKHEYRDPVTGDVLSLGEFISWKIQGLIRRWTFLILITIATLIVWITNNPAALLWWNLCASYLALVIESIVGLAMFAQTKRDAVILRRVAEMTSEQTSSQEHQAAVLDRLAALEQQNLVLLQRIDQLLEKPKRGRPRTKNPLPSSPSERI